NDRRIPMLQLLNAVVQGAPLGLVHRPVNFLEQAVHLGIGVPLVVFARGIRVAGDETGVPVDLVFRKNALPPTEDQRRVLSVPLGTILTEQRGGAHRVRFRIDAGRQDWAISCMVCTKLARPESVQRGTSSLLPCLYKYPPVPRVKPS